MLGVYLFPLYLVIFSLSGPPADLPLCGLMFIPALFGLVLARRESRAWRIVWAVALTAAIIFGVLEIIAGRNIAHQRSQHDSSERFTMPNQIAGVVARRTPEFIEMMQVGASLRSGSARRWGR
jgi:hypothetical protein